MKISILLSFLILNFSLFAQWNGVTSVNNLICTNGSDKYYPAIASDGAGGAIVVWSDARGGSSDIYAQRIDANGVVQWTVNGITICAASGDQYSPYAISDGAGGAIIVWQDYRNDVGFTNSDIFAQRVNASGVVQWTANGIAVCNNASAQFSYRITPFGTGGAAFTWSDDRNGSTNTDIYAQVVDGAGSFLWTLNGIPVCSASSYQINAYLVSDGSANVTFAWADNRSGNYDIYAQRFNATGIAQWTADGIVVCNAGDFQATNPIVNDESGGVIIAWEDVRSGTSDIYAQRINSSGAVQWTANGVIVSDAFNVQSQPEAIPDGNGGMILFWLDYRNGLDFSIRDLYAQRINSSGVSQWVSNGLAMCTATGYQLSYKLISDGLDGAVFTWHDERSGGDIYAQKVSGAGTVTWAGDGVIVGNATGNQDYPVLVTDNNGGAVIAWSDGRAGTLDIYASHLFSTGTLPVNFISFYAEKKSAGNLLTWHVADQVNNKLFEVEVSEDGIAFQKAGTVYASASQSRYTFLHQMPALAGVRYYRIKQVDFDTNFKFSKIISIRESTSRKDWLSVYPNPSTSFINVAVSETGDVLRITDFIGKEIKRVNITSVQTSVNIESLPAGMFNCSYKGVSIKILVSR